MIVMHCNMKAQTRIPERNSALHRGCAQTRVTRVSPRPVNTTCQNLVYYMLSFVLLTVGNDKKNLVKEKK